MPFSGKTTLGKAIAKYLDVPYVSLDEINEARGLFGGDGIPVEEWEKTHYLAMQQSVKLMKTGVDIILDDTNCFRWLRDRFLNGAFAPALRSKVSEAIAQPSKTVSII